MSTDELPSWRETTAKQSMVQCVDAVTDHDSPDFVPERDRIAVFDNDGTLWTEQPGSPAGVRAGPGGRAGPSHQPRRAARGRMDAPMKLVALTHAGITTDEFDALCRSWLASARHPRFGRPYPQTVYQPMLELLACRPARLLLLDLLRRRQRLHAGLGGRCLPAAPHRVIGSIGATDFRVGDGGPELVKSATVQVIDDGRRNPARFDHVGGNQQDVFGRGGSAVSEEFKGTINVDIRDSVPDWSPFEPPKALMGRRAWCISCWMMWASGDQQLWRAD